MRVVYSPDHRAHDPGAETWGGVPRPSVEVPDRVERIRAALEDAGHTIVAPTEHGAAPIVAIHDRELLRFLAEAWASWEASGRQGEAIPDTVAHPALREGMGPAPEPTDLVGRLGFWCFETMTPIGPGTYRAARGAVDVALTAADLVLGGEAAAYGLCRPPGHHVARAVYGGYCYLNNAAIAAEHVTRQTGQAVAVLDLDYHHGNGTQQIFYERADVLYVSLHGDPARAYPYFSGHADETGAGQGRGTTMNVPLPPGCDDRAYLEALEPALERLAVFGASITVVSLGFDTYREDPICDLALTTDAYEEVGRRVASAGGRLVIVQEGGYHLDSVGPNARRWVAGVDDPHG